MALNRVFIIQQPVAKDAKSGTEKPAHDYSAAEVFGKVEILAPNNKMILTPDLFKTFIDKRLHDFDPAGDYLIPTGDYTVLLYVGMILAQRYRFVRVLRWVPQIRSYQPLKLQIG